jgi:hypothetical protein
MQHFPTFLFDSASVQLWHPTLIPHLHNHNIVSIGNPHVAQVSVGPQPLCMVLGNLLCRHHKSLLPQLLQGDGLSEGSVPTATSSGHADYDNSIDLRKCITEGHTSNT